MANKQISLDSRQLALDFTQKVDRYIEAKDEILAAIEAGPVVSPVENEFEACIEIAASIKRALRESGMSREQLVDAVNAYFGRSEQGAQADPPSCRRPLSIHMLNHFLSKPTEYPIEAYYLFAIQRVTRSLEPAKTLVAPEGAQVISGAEVRQMQLGKITEMKEEMRRLERELKGKR